MSELDRFCWNPLRADCEPIWPLWDFLATSLAGIAAVAAIGTTYWLASRQWRQDRMEKEERIRANQRSIALAIQDAFVVLASRVRRLNTILDHARSDPRRAGKAHLREAISFPDIPAELKSMHQEYAAAGPFGDAMQRLLRHAFGLALHTRALPGEDGIKIWSDHPIIELWRAKLQATSAAVEAVQAIYSEIFDAEDYEDLRQALAQQLQRADPSKDKPGEAVKPSV